MLYKKPGMKVAGNELIARLYTNNKDRIDAAAGVLLDSISFNTSPVQQRPLVLAYVDKDKNVLY